MAGPRFGAAQQGFSGGAGAGAGDGVRVPDTINFNRSGVGGSSFKSGPVQDGLQAIDPELDSLLCLLQEEDQQNSAACWEESFSSTDVNASFSSTSAAQTVYNLQPRVYERTRSLTCTYTPPPIERVVQFQFCRLDKPPVSDIPLGISSIPARGPLNPAPIINPTIPPHHPPVDAASPISMRAHQPSAACAPLAPFWSFGTQHIQYPDPEFTFDLAGDFMASWSNTPPGAPPSVERDHNQISLHQDPQVSRPTGPHMIINGYSGQQDLMNLEPLPSLDFSARGPTRGPACSAASPSCMQNSHSNGAASDSAVAMEISSMSMPTLTSSGFYQMNSLLPERRSVSVPPSPTPSVNKNVTHESTAHEGTRRLSHDNYNQQVQFRVKTDLLNLHDGFTWKKYGAKEIKKKKHPRSYFNCEKKRSGCKVVKRAERCTDDERFVLFTYLGRHNHEP